MNHTDCIDYALGELHGERREAFERALATSPELQQELQETIRFMGSLRSVTKSTDSLDPAQRERLIAACRRNITSRKRSSKIIFFAIPLSLAALAVIALILGTISSPPPTTPAPVAATSPDEEPAHDEPLIAATLPPEQGTLPQATPSLASHASQPAPTHNTNSITPLSQFSTSIASDCKPFDPENHTTSLRLGTTAPKHTRRTSENPFIKTSQTPNTFVPMSVTTDSYAHVRREILSGRLPDPASVRIDELVNAFSYPMENAQACGPYAVDLEAGRAPWNRERLLVKVGIALRNPSEDTSLLFKNVSISLKFNPELVSEYRLLGYENQGGSERIVNTLTNPPLPFSVTAIYEIVPTQQLKGDSSTGELCVLTTHHKFASDTDCRHASLPFYANALKLDAANSPDFQFAAAVVGFGMKLARNPEATSLDWSSIESLAANNLGTDATRQRADFVDLVQRAAQLSAA